MNVGGGRLALDALEREAREVRMRINELEEELQSLRMRQRVVAGHRQNHEPIVDALEAGTESRS